MKQSLLPITTIASCAGLAFTAGTKLGIEQTHPSLVPPSSAIAEEVVKQPQPKQDSEPACPQSNLEVCKQTSVTKDLLEFQARLQRIANRAKDEISSLKDESTLPMLEMNSSDSRPIDEAMQQDTENTVRPQTIQKNWLKQVVSSSLQPTASMDVQSVESIEDNDPVEMRQTISVMQKVLPVVEPVIFGNADEQ